LLCIERFNSIPVAPFLHQQSRANKAKDQFLLVYSL
jgi:hypothetical protein